MRYFEKIGRLKFFPCNIFIAHVRMDFRQSNKEKNTHKATSKKFFFVALSLCRFASIRIALMHTVSNKIKDSSYSCTFTLFALFALFALLLLGTVVFFVSAKSAKHVLGHFLYSLFALIFALPISE